LHAYLRTSDGTYTNLGVPGTVGTKPNGVSSAGEIAGAFMDARHKLHGFLRFGGGIFAS